MLDDAHDNMTLTVVQSMASRDHRVRFFVPGQGGGVIGERKREAAMLGRGELLLELDHDDSLTEDALEIVRTVQHTQIARR